MGYDIFLSYRRADQPIARALVDALKARGVAVWWDQMIDAGVDWRDAIVDGLTDADMLVILFSDDCNNSKQLKKELALADDMDKNVVPVLIEDIKPRGHFLYELASRNWIQVFPDPHKKVNELADRLTRVAEMSPGGLEGVIPEPAPAPAAPPIMTEDDPTGDLSETAVAAPEISAPPPVKAPPAPSPIVDAATRKAMIRKTGARKAGAKQSAPSAKGQTQSQHKKKRRHYLPFRLIDLLVLIPAGLFYLNQEHSNLSRIDAEDLTELLAMAAVGLAGFGAVVFPIRYYMRRLRLKEAMLHYSKSSLTLYALLIFAGLWYASMRGDIGEVLQVCLGFGLVWLGFAAVAFVVYGLLHFQRTVRSFRSNVESI